MNEYLDKLPEITDRTIPDNWDPVAAGSDLYQALNAFRKVTGEICRILWIAKSKLSVPGHRSDINDATLTYHHWLKDNGVNPRTASRWLERYDPLTNTIQEPKLQPDKLPETPSESDEPTTLKNVTPSEEVDVVDVPYNNNTYVDSLSIAYSELNHPALHDELNETDAIEVVKMFQQIIRKATRLRNDIRNRFAPNIKSQLEKDLFVIAKKSFTSKNSFELNWKIEIPKIWALVELAMKAEEPPQFLAIFITTAFELTESNDKFWSDKPFLPSSFVTEKMIPIMLKQVDKKGNNSLKPEMLSDIKEIFQK